MSDQIDTIAEKIKLGFIHQLVTLLGIPALCAMSWWGFTELTTIRHDFSSELTTIRQDIASLKGVIQRVDRLERQADARAPGYPLPDGRQLERDVHSLTGRVTALEKR